MNITPRTVALILLLLGMVGVFAALLVYGIYKQDAATSYFSSVLKNANIQEAVEVAGRTYKITDGTAERIGDSAHQKETGPFETFQALRLAYAVTLARRSPLIALEGTDPGALERTVHRLVAVRQGYADVQNNPEGRSLIYEALYPTDFLSSAARLEAARRAFLLERSDTREQEYNDALVETLRMYKKDLDTFVYAYDHVVDDNFRYDIVPGGTIIKQNILRASDALKSAETNVASTFSERMRCLSGEVGLCEPEDIQFPLPEMQKGPMIVQKTTPHSVEEVVQMLSRVYTLAMNDAGVQLFVIQKSACTGHLPFSGYFAIHEQSKVGGVPQIFYVGDLLFWEINLLKERKGAAIPRYLDARGMTYMPIKPTMFYVCPEVGQDQGKIFGLAKILQFQRGASVVQGLQTLPTVVNENDVINFIEKTAAQKTSESPLSRERYNTLTSLSLALKNESTGFEHLVEQIVSVGEQELRMYAIGVPVDVSPKRLLSTQSGFPSLFFGYNASLVGSANSVSVYENDGNAHLLSGWRQWSNTNGTISEQDIVRDMLLFREFHESPETFDTRLSK